jgi:uncharacterized protein YbjT (DUF2867 family)
VAVTILITGATGTTGSTAIKTLLELKVRVRALVHKKDARSEQLSAQGVEIVQGDLFDFETVSEALTPFAHCASRCLTSIFTDATGR